jgi:putative transposase
VVDNHQLIAVEDLRLKFLAASRLARKAADIALGATRRELVERAVRAGRQVVNVAPAYTSMTCSRCFARTTQRLGLAERTFRCHDCGYTDTRDRNAARTILALAERGQTSADGVSHASASSPEVAVAVRPELQIPRR